jgi:hypothetical protein
LTPSPILKALSSIRTSGAKTLLMGGQACVFYGAAEFSRDLDILLLIDPNNLARFESALGDLQAENIAVPPFDVAHLLRGHAIHFRCHRPDVADVRVDVMSTLRGAVGFEELWSRRTAIEVEGEVIDMLALEDLVDAKKTQRDKDWPMIRRLVEQSYFRSESGADPQKIEFWLRELRTPELLITVAAAHPYLAKKIGANRAAVQASLREEVSEVAQLLEEEEREERRRDREYWAPLKQELEQLRRSGKR